MTNLKKWAVVFTAVTALTGNAKADGAPPPAPVITSIVDREPNLLDAFGIVTRTRRNNDAGGWIDEVTGGVGAGAVLNSLTIRFDTTNFGSQPLTFEAFKVVLNKGPAVDPEIPPSFDIVSKSSVYKDVRTYADGNHVATFNFVPENISVSTGDAFLFQFSSGLTTGSTIQSMAGYSWDGWDGNLTGMWEYRRNGVYSADYGPLVAHKLDMLVTPLVTPAVPEPETYAMMLAGLGVLGAVARRREKGMALAA